MNKHARSLFLLLAVVLQASCASPAIGDTDRAEAVQIETATTDRGAIQTTLPAPGILTMTQPVLDQPAITPTATLTNTPVVAQTICSPLAEHPLNELAEIVSDPYNPPANHQDGRHMGVDFSYYRYRARETIQGVAVQAIFSGVVAGAFTENTIPYGYSVIIETPLADIASGYLDSIAVDGFGSLYIQYAHLANEPEVQRDQVVTCGELLGDVGQTGGVDTPYLIPHLHVEMRLGPAGQRFDEIGYYDTRISEQARQNYLRWRLSGDFPHFDPMLILGNEVAGDVSTP